MTQKPHQPSPFEPGRDLRTDYVLIAAGVGAALIALVYLLVI
jgi:hypothetical protein